jgi:hypothetical protein
VQEKWKFSWPWTTEHQHNDACCLHTQSFSLQRGISFSISPQLCETMSLSQFIHFDTYFASKIFTILDSFNLAIVNKCLPLTFQCHSILLSIMSLSIIALGIECHSAQCRCVNYLKKTKT